MVALSRAFHLWLIIYSVVLQPRHCQNNVGLGYSPFARHYLGNHFTCFLFLRLLRCFSSPGLLPVPIVIGISGFPTFSREGCPIRRLANQRLFAPPRDFSQLITSFIASESQGILHAPLLTFLLVLLLIFPMYLLYS